MTPSQRAVVSRRLVDRAPSMEFSALLRLLDYYGFGAERVLVRSARNASSPQRLIESLSFREAHAGHSPDDVRPCADPLADAGAWAIIEVNTGLLSAQTPLPGYLVALLDDPRVREEALRYYLAFLDHVALSTLFYLADVDLGPQSTLSREGPHPLLAAVNLNCPSSLHWLFSVIYPELKVQVRRASVRRSIDMPEFIIGFSQLGEPYAFHGSSEVPSAGFEIALDADDWRSPAGEPWSREAPERLTDGVLPLLAGSDVSLRVQLRFLGRGGAFRLLGGGGGAGAAWGGPLRAR